MLLAFFVLITTFFCWLFIKVKPLHVDKSLPGPKSYPLIGIFGAILETFSTHPSEVARLCDFFGGTWGGKLPNCGGLPGAVFFIYQERTFRHVLSDVDSYSKEGAITNALEEVLGKGIFAADGTLWKLHRKLMSNMFSKNLIKHNCTITQGKLFQIVDKFRDRFESGEESFEVDIQDVFFRLTFDIITEITFGIDLDSVGKEKQHSFPTAFDEIIFLCQKRLVDPFFSLKRRFQVGKEERRIRELKGVIDRYAEKIISDRRVNLEKYQMDILSRYLIHAENEGIEITKEELRDVVMNIMIAGRDTTACALAWTWYELSRNPSVVAKIINEVESICGSGDNADYSYDNMNRLKYTHCVALETLRLHPSVPQNSRVAAKASTLSDGTFVPKGAAISMAFYASGRCEDTWGKDALIFRPERFYDEKEPSPYKFPMFHAGPRICLGKPLALMNMKLAMSILLPMFNFTDEKKHNGEYFWAIVMSMKGGFPMQVSNRVPNTD